MATTKKSYKKKVLLIAGVIIVITSLYEYFEGYKNHHIISGATFLFNFLSWITIWYMLFNKQLESKTISFKKNKSKWLAQKVNHGFLYIILMFFFGGNLYITHELANKRIKDIFNKTTEATIIQFDYRARRGGATCYAIFTYNTDKGVVEQACDNYNNKFKIGETYEVTYSVEYPEMYRMGKQIKNTPD
jgi:hypothetical protein